jgi:formate-dependent nitrite reductase membrane component NrfD
MSGGGHHGATMSPGQKVRSRARALTSRAAAARRSEGAAAERRDMTPAVGTGGGPAPWRRASPGAAVGLHRRRWEDARWSYLYGAGSGYASASDPAAGYVEEANRRGRGGDVPPEVQGPVMKAPVWTWEVPLYFWFGGMAAGSSFVALACDLAGDERSARAARKIAVAALLPSPPLLIMDLGRPERFYKMLRIFKPRSPMSTGAWCLTAFGGLGSAAVAADLSGRPRAAKAIGGANAVVGGYLGSYAGVLLAATAVPVWARSRLFLGPIFVATATLTGAATTRLVLVAAGMPEGHPTREALGRVESGAVTAELLLSALNEQRLGFLGEVLEEGRPGTLFRTAKWLARTGMLLRLARRRGGPWTHHVASLCYLAAALCFRYAWVVSGPPSAHDDGAVARMARSRATAGEPAPGPPVVVTQH